MERVRVADVVRITSLPARTVQDMAASGNLPGAAKMGKVWTFDPIAVRAWVRQKEAEACRERTSISAAPLGGGASKSVDESTDEAYARLIHGRRRVDSKRGKPKSHASM